MVRWFIACFAALSALAGPPRTFDPEQDVTVALRQGAVLLSVPEGAHLKAAFMEIALKPGTPGRLKAGPLPPTPLKDELGDGIWRGQVRIPVAGEGLPAQVDLVVTYQPCTEGEGGACYPPTDRTLTVKAADIPALAPAPAGKAAVKPVEGPDKPSAVLPADQPKNEPAATPAPKAAGPQPANPAGGPSLIWTFLAVFGFGLAAAFTPCVYPMIPITMAIIGAKGGGKARGFALSFTLVLGMAVTYTSLGVLAARTGAAFGAFAQSPWFLIPVSVLFALFALSLFGAFEIRLPDSIQNRLQGGGPRKGYLGAFVMGLVLGPLSAPCVGPVIGTVLLAIAKEGKVLMGAAQLFTFSLGMGVLFMAVGTFSASLPRSGDWLDRFKHGMGLVVLAFAAWNVRLVVPEGLGLALWCAVALVAAVEFGAFRAAESMLAGLFKGLAVIALVLAALLGVRSVELLTGVVLLRGGGAAAQAEKAPSLWMEQDFEGALAKAKAEGKLVLVDTYADWCAQCKELDEATWPDPAVAGWLKANAVAVRIDTDKVRKDLAGRLEIRSYPTVILLDADGRELRRSLGFQKPAAMLAFLKN